MLDCGFALHLLDDIEEQIDKANAWAWLRKHEPESYKQLTTKLKNAAKGLTASGKSELGSLARVFEWCEEHYIALDLFDLPKHSANYREAASYLLRITNHASTGASNAQKAETVQFLRDTIATIKHHGTRRETRKLVRNREPAQAHPLSDGGSI